MDQLVDELYSIRSSLYEAIRKSNQLESRIRMEGIIPGSPSSGLDDIPF